MMIGRLSNTSWVAWDDQKNDQPLIETCAGQRSNPTIEFYDDGGYVAGVDGRMFKGTWAIREHAGQPPFLHLTFGNEDDNLAITATIDDEGIMTLSSSFSKYYELLFSGEFRPKRYKFRDQISFLKVYYRRSSAKDFVKFADKVLQDLLHLEPAAWSCQKWRHEKLTCLSDRLAKCSSTEEKRRLYRAAMDDGVL